MATDIQDILQSNLPPGPQGVQGTQGITGAGTQGTQGITGSQGTQGTQGITGAGIQGTQGVAGAFSASGSEGNIQFYKSGNFSSNSDISFIEANTSLVVGNNRAVTLNNAPLLDLSQTWNNAANTFTALKINITNTASAAASKLLDLRVGGNDKFRVKRDGTIAATGTHPSGLFESPQGSIFSWDNGGYWGTCNFSLINGSDRSDFYTSGGVITQSGFAIGTISADGGTSNILMKLFSDSANILALRNGTANQAFRIYRTYTDGSNLAYTSAKQDSTNGYVLDSVNAGTGTEPTNLLDLQLNGASKVRISKNGTLFFATGNRFTSIVPDPNGELKFLDNSTTQIFKVGNPDILPHVSVGSSLSFGWSTDLMFWREAANALAQRNGANPQTFNLYNTYTDASNYERATIAWSSNILQIGTQKAGSGQVRNLELQTDGTTRLTVSSSGITTAAGLDFISQGGLQLASTYELRYTSRLRVSSSSDGNLLLSNWATGDFGRLQLGNTTSSYPAIKRSSANIQFRLADDSDFTIIESKGLTIVGGTNTLNTEPLLLNVTGTWNNAANTFTGIKANITDTASATTSLLIDLQVGGSSKFKINKTGSLFLGDSGSYDIRGQYSSGFYNTGDWRVNRETWIHRDYGIQWDAAGQPTSNSTDLVIRRDAAGVLAQRNGANPQTFNLYNTYTDASNYERGFFRWANNVLYIGTANAGTGSARSMEFQSNGVSRMTIGATGDVSIGTAAGSLTLNFGPYSAIINNSFGINLSTSNSIRPVRVSGSSGLYIGSNNGVDTPAGTITVQGGVIKFGGITSSFPAIRQSSANIQFRLADNSDFTIIESKGLTIVGGTNTANSVQIYAEDDGTGKTRLMALFATGVAQQIAIEP